MATDNKTLGVYAAIAVTAAGIGAYIGTTLSKPKPLGKLKLTYLEGRGLAETTRLVLSEAGADWEDVRLSKDGVAAIKGKLPYGQVPILESSTYPGVVLAQSNSIARFVAKHYHLYGANVVEAAKIDSVLDAILDIRVEARLNVFGPHVTEDKKPEGKKKMENEVFPKHFANLEALVRANPSGWFVGDKISLADITFFNVAWSWKTDYPNILNAFPSLQALYQRVSERPRIAQWLHKRPVTPW